MRAFRFVPYRTIVLPRLAWKISGVARKRNIVSPGGDMPIEKVEGGYAPAKRKHVPGFQNPYSRFRIIPFVGLNPRFFNQKDLRCNQIPFGWRIAHPPIREP
jgi:hypothetical protein